MDIAGKASCEDCTIEINENGIDKRTNDCS